MRRLCRAAVYLALSGGKTSLLRRDKFDVLRFDAPKPVAGSAAFQAAGVAEAPFRGFHLTLPLAGTRGSRQDAGAPRGVGAMSLYQ